MRNTLFPPPRNLCARCNTDSRDDFISSRVAILSLAWQLYKLLKSPYFRIRPYSVECTRSRSISRVKQPLLGLAFGWVTILTTRPFASWNQATVLDSRLFRLEMDVTVLGKSHPPLFILCQAIPFYSPYQPCRYINGTSLHFIYRRWFDYLSPTAVLWYVIT